MHADITQENKMIYIVLVIVIITTSTVLMRFCQWL